MHVPLHFSNLSALLFLTAIKVRHSEVVLQVKKMGNGQNYENQNVENQKDLRNLRRRSEHRKDKFKQSERRKANYHKVEKS